MFIRPGSLIAAQGPHSPPSPAASPPPGACRPGGPEGAGSAAGARPARGLPEPVLPERCGQLQSASSSRGGGKRLHLHSRFLSLKVEVQPLSVLLLVPAHRTVGDLASRSCQAWARAALPAAGTVAGLAQPSPWAPTSGRAPGPGRALPREKAGGSSVVLWPQVPNCVLRPTLSCPGRERGAARDPKAGRPWPGLEDLARLPPRGTAASSLSRRLLISALAWPSPGPRLPGGPSACRGSGSQEAGEGALSLSTWPPLRFPREHRHPHCWEPAPRPERRPRCTASCPSPGLGERGAPGRRKPGI